jgi:hypothetical protein
VKAHLCLLSLLLTACGAPVDHGPIALSPSDDTRELVERAASEWTQATGIDILIGAGGIPVTAAEEALDEDGNPACGITPVRRGKRSREFRAIERVVIAMRPPAGCPRWQTGRTMLHEIGHVVCEFGVDGDPENGCHSETGLMATKANETQGIDGASLEVVCAHATCTRFEPQQ